MDSKWPLKIKLQDLRGAVESPPHEPIYNNNIPIYKNNNLELLEEENLKEEFHKYKNYYVETHLEVSNFGRVKLDGEILPQYNTHESYLFINLPFSVMYYKPYIADKVHRLVAETFFKKPAEDYNTVHHITNNGYDNRISNLIWVTYWQHLLIHPELKINFNKKYLSKTDLENMIMCYKDITITEYDKNRITQIEKQLRYLTDNKINDEIENIINEYKKM